MAKHQKTKPRIRAKEARATASRILKANAELFGRLKGEDSRTAIKRTIKDYRKTLRKLA
jgi:hypothetical protein